MTFEFVSTLNSLFLEKKEILDQIDKVTRKRRGDQIEIRVTVREIVYYLGRLQSRLQSINQNILSLTYECPIIEDISEYYSDLQSAIKIESEIERILIELSKDPAFYQNLTSNEIRIFLGKVFEINRYFYAILVYIFGSDVETAKHRIIEAMVHSDFKLGLYLAENGYLPPFEKLEVIRFLLSIVRFKVRIEEPKIRKFLVGEHIHPLGAQVVANQNIFDRLIEDIKNEQGYSFIWYVGQTHKETTPIHTGRLAQISDAIIPLDFSGDRAYLIVVLFNEKMQEVTRDVINMRLIKNTLVRVEPIEPPQPPRPPEAPTQPSAPPTHTEVGASEVDETNEMMKKINKEGESAHQEVSDRIRKGRFTYE